MCDINLDGDRIRACLEIEGDCAGSQDNPEVAVVERGTASQRRLLQRLDVFKASGTEANLLGNQYAYTKWSMSQS